MGPMTDPMAGNGKMTWQRWDWRKGDRIDQIKDGQHGSGLMETVAWHPDGAHFIMAGRQAQGTWNAAVFSSADGSLVHSWTPKNASPTPGFTADGKIRSSFPARPANRSGRMANGPPGAACRFIRWRFEPSHASRATWLTSR